MNKDYDAVLIIPNEKKTNGKVYFEKLKKGENHYNKEFEFIKKYNITNLPCKTTFEFELATLGHIIFEIDGTENCLNLYLPETITERQRKIINKLKIKCIIKKFDFYDFVGGFIMDKEGQIIGNVHGYSEIMDFINQSVDIEEIQYFRR